MLRQIQTKLPSIRILRLGSFLDTELGNHYKNYHKNRKFTFHSTSHKTLIVIGSTNHHEAVKTIHKPIKKSQKTARDCTVKLALAKCLRWSQVNCSAGKITCGCWQKSPQATIAACGFRMYLAVIYLRSDVTHLKPLLCLSGWIFQNWGRFLPSITTKVDQSNHLLPLKSVLNPSPLNLFWKSWTVHCWLFNPLFKKIQLAEPLFSLTTEQLDRFDQELAAVTPLIFFTFFEWKKNVKQN